MDINRHNYEAWFLDYTEGNLNEQQVADLLIFLEQHKDLKAEFENDFGNIVLKPEAISFKQKDLLKKQTAISESNIDDFLIADNEGLLVESEKRELEIFIEQNPAYKKDEKLFSLVYLAKTNAVRFPNKNQLKKRAGFIIPLYVKYAAAAAIALFIIFSLINKPNSKEPILATEDPIEEKVFPNSSEINTLDEVSPEIEIAEAAELEKSELQLDSFDESLEGNDNVNSIATINNEARSKESQKLKLSIPDFKLNSIANHQMAAQEFETFPQVPIIDFESVEPYDEVTLAENTAKPIRMESEPIGIWDYAGIRLKEDVLKQDNVSDGRLRENDVAKALVSGVDKVANSNIQFTDKSKQERIKYGFSIGKFGFERSSVKK